MPKTSSPSSHDTPLIDLLKDVGCGRLQLPAFQRGWRWDGDRICRLLASLTLGYPMGAIMVLESGAGTQFGSRLFEGVPIKPEDRPKPLLLALDGQQRLTSLYRALCSKEPVLMPDEESSPGAGLLFYLDVAKCLDPSADRLDAVVAVPGSRILKNFREKGAVLDLSDREKEFGAGMFPLSSVFDAVPWFMGWIRQDGYAHAQEREKIYDAFSSEILGTVAQYRLPVITLPEDTPAEAVCQVFENVNRGGVVLTVFELATAKYAAGDFDLRRDWEENVRPAVHGDAENLPTDLMQAVEGKDFLTAVTLFASHERNAAKAAPGTDAAGSSCKKSDVLKLSLEDYQTFKPRLVEGF
nr:DUF262 domain-containing protein [Desulfovibrio sp.]